jgi:hypothetical protein
MIQTGMKAQARTNVTRISLVVALLLGSCIAQDRPKLEQRGETLLTLPDEPKPQHHYLRHTIEFGSAGTAAKIADDSCDFIIGPTKARYVGASAAVLTYFIVHHYLKKRHAR